MVESCSLNVFPYLSSSFLICSAYVRSNLGFLLTNTLNLLYNYFNKNNTHKDKIIKLIDETSNIFEIILKEQGINKSYFNQKFGKAQKLINMSFKYLYCFDDFRIQHREKIENCHIPLDSFRLNWYKDNIILNKNKSKNNNAKKIIFGQKLVE